MKINDNKRREVAEELRALDVSDLGDADNVIDTIEESGALFALILHVANDYRPGLHYATSHFVARDAVELFADLIDRPTCDDVGDDWTFRCSACGCGLDIRVVFEDEPTMWKDGAAQVPKYCPNCGANVVMTSD